MSSGLPLHGLACCPKTGLLKGFPSLPSRVLTSLYFWAVITALHIHQNRMITARLLSLFPSLFYYSFLCSYWSRKGFSGAVGSRDCCWCWHQKGSGMNHYIPALAESEWPQCAVPSERAFCSFKEWVGVLKAMQKTPCIMRWDRLNQLKAPQPLLSWNSRRSIAAQCQRTSWHSI